MLQFCYLRLYFGTESVLCRLLHRMARMDIDSNLIKLGQFYFCFNDVTAKIIKKLNMVSAP